MEETENGKKEMEGGESVDEIMEVKKEKGGEVLGEVKEEALNQTEETDEVKENGEVKEEKKEEGEGSESESGSEGDSEYDSSSDEVLVLSCLVFPFLP